MCVVDCVQARKMRRGREEGRNRDPGVRGAAGRAVSGVDVGGCEGGVYGRFVCRLFVFVYDLI